MGLVNVDISANTNCAEVGDILKIKLHIKNNSDRVIEIKGDPPIDINISPYPAGDPNRVNLWSDSADFPVSSQIVAIDPGILVEYQWDWPVDSMYKGDNAIDSSIMVRSVLKTIYYGDTDLTAEISPVVIGVHWLGFDMGAVECSLMPVS